MGMIKLFLCLLTEHYRFVAPDCIGNLLVAEKR